MKISKKQLNQSEILERWNYWLRALSDVKKVTQ